MSMSTEEAPDRPGIPLTHASSSKSYRLLELPPDLQSLLESTNPPVLHLEPGSPHAVLVTPTTTTTTTSKRYILTQRNTSNSLILLTPAPATATANVPTPPAGEEEPGLDIIGTVHETMELTPEPPRPERKSALVGGSSRHAGGGAKNWDEKFGDGR